MIKGEWQSLLIGLAGGSRVIILTDSNVVPLIVGEWQMIVIPAGEENKNLDTLAGVWRQLEDMGATRSTILANVGGGVVTDLGGFAAATFKRGMRCVNIPTTLLGMADASIGGKTAIDFNGLKNEVGVFSMPEEVIIDFSWLDSLPDREVRNGMAEVVKSMLLDSQSGWYEMATGDIFADRKRIGEAAWRAACFKERIVTEDPEDRGLRHILNFGHTIGHAVEAQSFAAGTPLSHGEAVAIGMREALKMSCEMLGFPEEESRRYEECIWRRWYLPNLPEGWKMPSADELRCYMRADKKNRDAGHVMYVLLRSVADPVEVAVEM